MTAAGRAAFLLLALIDLNPALAHAPLPGIGGFYGGLVHPVLVTAHGLALVGLGLMTGQQAGHVRRVQSMMTFAAGFAAGVGLIAAAFAFEGAQSVVLATAAVAGILVLLARPMPPIVCGVLTAVGGAALALDSVPDEISKTASLVALAGTGAAACLILVAIAWLATAARRHWHRIGIRILGSWTAAGAMLGIAMNFSR